MQHECFAADDERAQKAIETRQGLLKVVGHYFGPIVGMAKGQVPGHRYKGANANKIAQLAPMIPASSYGHSQRRRIIRCSDGIWEDSDDYKAKAATATERALALAAAADQGQGAFLKAVGGLGSACKVVMRTTEENSIDQTAHALVWDLPLRLFHWALRAHSSYRGLPQKLA